MGHIRGHGCPDLLVYCVSPWCNHDAKLTLDWLPNDTALLDLDPRMVCTACGLIGVCYAEAKQYMVLWFRHGGDSEPYHFCALGPDVFKEFLEAESMGTFYNERIGGTGTRNKRGPFDCRETTVYRRFRLRGVLAVPVAGVSHHDGNVPYYYRYGIYVLLICHIDSLQVADWGRGFPSIPLKERTACRMVYRASGCQDLEFEGFRPPAMSHFGPKSTTRISRRPHLRRRKYVN